MMASDSNLETSLHAAVMDKCRICYRGLLVDDDAKDLYEQRNNALLYHIEAITGVWIRELHGVPHHMCPQCQEDLQNAIEFRENCIRTEFELTQNIKGLTECDSTNRDVESEEIETELENVLYEQSMEQNEDLSESELLSDTECPLIESMRKELCGPAGDGPCPVSQTTEELKPDSFSVLNKPIKLKIQTPGLKRSKLTKEEKNLRRREQLRSKPISYVCEQCGHAFRMAGHLKMHMLRHSGVKNFECPKCSKKFYSSYLRDSHLRVRHNGERPYPCNYCSETFAYCNIRQRHEREIHGAPPRIVMRRSSTNRKVQEDSCKRHFCHLCTKSYASKYSLSWHMHSHTEVRNLKCKSCDMTFPDPVSVKRHERSHEKRPFHCDACLKGFFVLSKLNEHKLIHSGDRPFRCEICDSYFRYKYNLTTHRLSKTHKSNLLKIQEQEP